MNLPQMSFPLRRSLLLASLHVYVSLHMRACLFTYLARFLPQPSLWCATEWVCDCCTSLLVDIICSISAVKPGLCARESKYRHTYIYTYIYIYTYSCMYIHIHVNICIYIHLHIYTYTHTHIYIYICICICICVDIYIYICMYILIFIYMYINIYIHIWLAT